MTFLLTAGTILLSVVSFLLGKIFSQSEKVIEQKKSAYQAFLEDCPAPNEAYLPVSDNFELKMQRKLGMLSIYASPGTLTAAASYFNEFAEAQSSLSLEDEPLHPAFKGAASKYNKMIIEMRKDVLAWSVFAHREKRTEKPVVMELKQ